jgi:hypothetical protein
MALQCQLCQGGGESGGADSGGLSRAEGRRDGGEVVPVDPGKRGETAVQLLAQPRAVEGDDVAGLPLLVAGLENLAGEVDAGDERSAADHAGAAMESEGVLVIDAGVPDAHRRVEIIEK